MDDPDDLTLLGLPVTVDPSLPAGVLEFKDGDKIAGYLVFDVTGQA